MIKHIHLMFVDWAEYYLRVSVGPSGYPRRTIEHSLKEMGGNLISGEGVRVGSPVPSVILETENLILKLPKDDQKFLVEHYFSYDTIKEKAEKECTTIYRYRGKLHRIQQKFERLIEYLNQRRKYASQEYRAVQ